MRDNIDARALGYTTRLRAVLCLDAINPRSERTGARFVEVGTAWPLQAAELIRVYHDGIGVDFLTAGHGDAGADPCSYDGQFNLDRLLTCSRSHDLPDASVGSFLILVLSQNGLDVVVDANHELLAI